MLIKYIIKSNIHIYIYIYIYIYKDVKQGE